MPHRVNTKGDIGTAKNASDSYDYDNIYLSEEGWVYRHFKTADRTMWWDEILVAGQVKPAMSIHGKKNGGVSLTNPVKLGTDDAVSYQAGDGEFDIAYAGQPGHSPDYVNVVIDPADKTYDEDGSYRVPDNIQGTPKGWSSPGDPSNEENYPDQPPYVEGDAIEPNQYTVKQDPMPTPGADADPRTVNVGLFEDGTGGDTTSPQTVVATYNDETDTTTAGAGS